MERRSRVLFTMKSCHVMTVNYMKLKRCSKERKKDKFLVKWKGYEKPSWIDSKSIIETK